MAKFITDDNTINLGAIISTLWKSRKTFYKVLPIVFVLACVWILPQPRSYTCELKLAPELEGSAGNAIGSLASSFGLDLGGMQTSDAISPELYPDLLSTNDFITLLFPVEVENQDGTIKTTYYDYLCKYQKANPYLKPFKKAIKAIKGWFKDKNEGGDAPETVDPTHLTKAQSEIVLLISAKVSCNVNKKTGVISISVRDQDPVIATTIARTICEKLQEFIIDYRTKKARVDVEYYENLLADQLAEYENARREYIGFADSNRDIISPAYQQKLNDLENTMQLKYNSYTALQAQLMASRAKLQEKTPAFTTLKSPSVPVKATGPKRMIFVALMLILATMGTTGWILFKNMRKEEEEKPIVLTEE